MLINCWICEKELDTEKDSLFSTCTNPKHKQCRECEKKFKRTTLKKLQSKEERKHNRIHKKFLDDDPFTYSEVKYTIHLADGTIQTNRM